MAPYIQRLQLFHVAVIFSTQTAISIHEWFLQLTPVLPYLRSIFYILPQLLLNNIEEWPFWSWMNSLRLLLLVTRRLKYLKFEIPFHDMIKGKLAAL